MADSAILRRGRWAEAAIIEMLRDERPSWEIRRAKVYLRDPSIRLGATPDAVAVDPERAGFGVVQGKTITARVFERDSLNGERRSAYQLQALTEAMLDQHVLGGDRRAHHGRERGLATVVDMADHEEAEARIRARVARFWADRRSRATVSGRRPRTPEQNTMSAIWPKAHIKQALDLSANNQLYPAVDGAGALQGDRKERRRPKSAASRRRSRPSFASTSARRCPAGRFQVKGAAARQQPRPRADFRRAADHANEDR